MSRPSNRSIIAAFLVMLAAVGLYFGWREFWFLTDDAYIAFRYVSNSFMGHGYVWNAEPFRPVEGYTSFLYILIMDLVWRVLGIEPPQSANILSLIFSFGSLILETVGVMRMQLNRGLDLFRLGLVALTLTGLVANPTFLTWASSGLETALFNFCFLAWILCAVLIQQRDHWWRMVITATASLVYLARPDGILAVAGTLILLTVSFLGEFKRRQLSFKWFASIIPIIVPFVHLIWRKSYYGVWLPNTYYAKYVAAWPEAGIRYLLSFLIEYGVWLWVVLLIVFVIFSIRQTRKAGGGHKVWLNQLMLGLKKQPNRKVSTFIAVLVVIMHLGYYTIIIGGDHFEWRVYSHLPPLILLSSIYFLNALNLSALRAMIALSLIIAVSLPMPWVYHTHEKKINFLRVEDTLYITVSDKLPFFMWPLAKPQDRLQAWLTKHLVCVRWREQKLYQEDVEAFFPKRTFEIPAYAIQFPVGYFSNVGVAGWVFPRVAIIDGYGLNDYVIARHVSDSHRERRMAHDRYPPEKYVDSYVPNVVVLSDGEAQYYERLPEFELTRDRIKALDKYWEDKIVHGLTIPDSLTPPTVNLQ